MRAARSMTVASNLSAGSSSSRTPRRTASLAGEIAGPRRSSPPPPGGGRRGGGPREGGRGGGGAEGECVEAGGVALRLLAFRRALRMSGEGAEAEVAGEEEDDATGDGVAVDHGDGGFGEGEELEVGV